MLLEQFAVGGDRNFGYLVACQNSSEAAVIDPCFSPEMILDFAKENGLDIKYAFNTHGHYDHTNGNEAFTAATGLPVLGFGDIDAESGRVVEDGAEFLLGNETIRILYTPGHTEDSISLVFGDAVITGDTLFVGKVGGTDLGENARREYDSLHNKLMTLPESTRVFPGHDYGVAPFSTIGLEKETNPFIIQPDFEAFVHLKANWAEYKLAHGIK